MATILNFGDFGMWESLFVYHVICHLANNCKISYEYVVRLTRFLKKWSFSKISIFGIGVTKSDFLPE